MVLNNRVYAESANIIRLKNRNKDSVEAEWVTNLGKKSSNRGCHGLEAQSPYVQVKMKVSHSCPTLCDPMAYIVHGILQARILEWVAFPFSRGSSQPRDWTQVFHIAGRGFNLWATREAPRNLWAPGKQLCVPKSKQQMNWPDAGRQEELGSTGPSLGWAEEQECL